MEVATDDMAGRTDYWLEAYTDSLKVDVKYASEDELLKGDVEQYLEELKQGFLICL